MSKDVQCFARTRIAVEKRSFLWNIQNFSSIVSNEKKIHEIKSLQNGEQLMCLELFLTRGLICEKTVRVRVIPNFQNAKISNLQLSIVDATKKTNKCFQDEFVVCDLYESKEFTLSHTMRELMENKSKFLPNDVLSLQCHYTFSSGTVVEDIENFISDSNAVRIMEKDCGNLVEKSVLPLSSSILIDDVKSLLNNSFLSDIKLKTNSQTYMAHKTILSIRSPVFKAMFSSDMKETTKDCVDIEDLNDDAVLRMLRYVYSGEVEELDWAGALALYEAADKYEILNLKDICSSCIKNNLTLNNSCEALVLSDLHQDEDLKSFVQDFILKHGKDIISSEEWEQLMETHLKLAAETMRLKFKE